MVPLDGLEPPTRGLGNRCSVHLSYRGPNVTSRAEASTTRHYDTSSISPRCRPARLTCLRKRGRSRPGAERCRGACSVGEGEDWVVWDGQITPRECRCRSVPLVLESR